MFIDWVGACVAFHHCTQFYPTLVRTDLHLHNFAFAKKVLLPFDFPFPYFYHPNHLRFFFYNLTFEHSSGDLFAWWYSPLDEKKCGNSILGSFFRKRSIWLIRNGTSDSSFRCDSQISSASSSFQPIFTHTHTSHIQFFPAYLIMQCLYWDKCQKYIDKFTL